jgi:metal-responsive CopG/Arc/MetJ family transcriptional regulator
MRIRIPLIVEETLLAKIDEIAGEKHRRAATIETALREFIAREEKKGRAKPVEAPVKATKPTAAPLRAKPKAKAAASARR